MRDSRVNYCKIFLIALEYFQKSSVVNGNKTMP